ncbi:urease accessory protein uref [Trichococcus palustris]|jgi:urease accessory protein|uniref:Urease accessory protein UreF n=1 Tax=Trichococcus palustris TaxID=140314 RepID=A0A143YC23_9LACT|nr:urease accessory protein UreF [Trichococcus palustris]CZQ85228.1 urease accessory protein uref [Trichococcus palustris]SFK55356.1 urease accessory protein [Trichococcus palustris]
MKNDQHYLLHQINDSQFPVGSYAHSFGLETYIQAELIQDDEAVFQYIKSNLMNSVLYNEVLAISQAYDAAEQEKIEDCLRLEKKIRALRPQKEIREAYEKIGSRFVKTIDKMQITADLSGFHSYVDECGMQGLASTYSVAYGVLCANLQIEKEEALQGFLFSNTLNSVINCVKAVPISQLSGQKIMVQCYPVFDEMIEKCLSLSEDDLGKASPGFEIRSMQHENLYSRLYMS